MHAAGVGPNPSFRTFRLQEDVISELTSIEPSQALLGLQLDNTVVKGNYPGHIVQSLFAIILRNLVFVAEDAH